MGQAFVVIQGKLKANTEAQSLYQYYLRGTVPLMQKYQVGILAVGGGISSQYTTDLFPVNALLYFPSLEHVHSFFTDSDYIHIKQTYRDPAYEYLYLSAFETLADSNDPLSPLSDGTVTMELCRDAQVVDRANEKQGDLQNHKQASQGAIKADDPYLFAQGRTMSFMNRDWSYLRLWAPSATINKSSSYSDRDTLSHLSHYCVTQWMNRPPKSV